VFVGVCRLCLLHCAISVAAAQYGLFIGVYFVMCGFRCKYCFFKHINFRELCVSVRDTQEPWVIGRRGV
jgi:hypothetical protein